jgi:hypothetical protein
MKRIILLAGGSLLLLGLVIPTTDIVSPDWTVLVTDTAGHPVEGARVTVFSQQYTVESHDTEETKVTDGDGRVHFAQRKLHAIGLIRLLGAIRNLDQGAHASFGVHTYLAASKRGYGDPSTLDLFAQNERERQAHGLAQQSSHVVLLQCPSGSSGFGCNFPGDPEKPVLPLKLK